MERAENGEFNRRTDKLKMIKDEIHNIESAEAIFSQILNTTHKIEEKERVEAEMAATDSLYTSRSSSFTPAYTFLARLSHFNFTSNTIPLSLLDETNPDLMMLTAHLDNCCSLRKAFKVGVVYVGKDQADQRSILWNSEGSAMYEKMLAGLGRFVKEDKAAEVFNVAANLIYYATATYDITFHVSTLMTTNVNDAQQINKKKYIGNDSVHIVWSDNSREYRPGTIKSSFNFVHIVIHPLHNGLCRVKVERKKEKGQTLVDFFGPLMSGMVLPLKMLPPLLRYSAVNARKSINFKNLRIINPMSERKETIRRIVDKYSVEFKSKAAQRSAIINKLLDLSADS